MLMQCEKGLTSKLSGVKKIGGLFYPWIKKNAVIGDELIKTFSRERMFKTQDNGLGTFSVRTMVRAIPTGSRMNQAT